MSDIQKLAIEALQAIAIGEGDPAVIAAQTLAQIAEGDAADDFEMLLSIASRADSDDETFFDTWADIRDHWRARRGEAGKGDWSWWAGEVDGESYACEFNTRDEAIAWGKQEWLGDPFRIVEARFWADDLTPEDDVVPFAEARNAEVIEAEVSPCLTL